LIEQGKFRLTKIRATACLTNEYPCTPSVNASLSPAAPVSPACSFAPVTEAAAEEAFVQLRLRETGADSRAEYGDTMDLCTVHGERIGLLSERARKGARGIGGCAPLSSKSAPADDDRLCMRFDMPQPR